MAGRLTLWGASELLRSFFSRTAEPPGFFYLALIKEIAPTPYTSGAELDEPQFDSYARVEVPNDTTFWDSQEGQLHIIPNLATINFVTATEDWGRIAYWALCNAQTSGYVYFVGEIEESITISSGDQVSVAPGELVVELGPFFTTEEF